MNTQERNQNNNKDDEILIIFKEGYNDFIINIEDTKKTYFNNIYTNVINKYIENKNNHLNDIFELVKKAKTSKNLEYYREAIYIYLLLEALNNITNYESDFIEEFFSKIIYKFKNCWCFKILFYLIFNILITINTIIKSDIKEKSLRIYLYLYSESGSFNSLIKITNREISRNLHMNIKTVVSSIEELRKKGYLTIIGKTSNRKIFCNDPCTVLADIQSQEQKCLNIG